MPPTVNQGLSSDREKRVPRIGDRKSELVCRVKYCNTLPDIPFDPKFINYPFDANRYVRYKQTSLEKNYKYEVLSEHDMGVLIDLINVDAYAPQPNVQLHPTDEKLLEDDILAGPQDAKKSRHSHVSVSWLRRTEYISTEPTRFQPQTMEKIEATVGYAAKKKKKDEETYTDRESQLMAIEKTFADVKKPLENHYSKPGVTVVEEFPVFPDFDLWKYPCAQVIFDSDPAPQGKSAPAALEEMSQAMIRGVMDESGEQFVAYFLPTQDTLQKRKRDQDEKVEYMDEDEYDYLMAREYNWNVKNKASKGYEENYFLVMRDDGVYYNELETRVRLSKRRMKQGQQANNSRLVVRHRPLNAPEHKTQRFREKMLEPPGEEEEEEEEEEEDEEELEAEDKGSAKGSDDEGSEKSRAGSRSRSRSKSRDRSRSKSGSRTPRNKSGSRSRSRSGSRNSRERSRSGSRSKSHSKSRSRSRSKSKSRSRSRSGSRPRNISPTGSERSGASGKSAGSEGSRRSAKPPNRTGSSASKRSRGSGSESGGSKRSTKRRSRSGSPASKRSKGSGSSSSGSSSSGSDSD